MKEPFVEVVKSGLGVEQKVSSKTHKCPFCDNKSGGSGIYSLLCKEHERKWKYVVCDLPKTRMVGGKIAYNKTLKSAWKRIEKLEAQLKQPFSKRLAKNEVVKLIKVWTDKLNEKQFEIKQLKTELKEFKVNCFKCETEFEKKLLTKAEAELIKKLLKYTMVNIGNPEFRYNNYEELLKKLSFLFGNVDAGLGSREKTSEKTELGFKVLDKKGLAKNGDKQ